MKFQSDVVFLILARKHVVRQRVCKIASKRNHLKRSMRSEFNKLILDAHFRRYFRMDRDCFRKLCKTIENAIGEDAFLKETFLDDL